MSRLLPSRPIGKTAGLVSTAELRIPIPADAAQAIIYASTLCEAGVSTSSSLTGETVQVQTITAGDATGGTFTATFQGQTTGNLTYDESAADVQTALRGLSTVGSSGATCAGGALNSAPITVTWDGTVLAGDQPLITIDGTNLTGGVSASTRVPTVAVTTAAVTRRGYIEAGDRLIIDLDRTNTVDAYLFLKAISGTGTYRVSWVG